MRQPRRRRRNGQFTGLEVEAAERDAKAMHLRSLGLTYDQIAMDMGYGWRGSAHAAVQRGIQRTMQDAGDAARNVEIQRLDTLLQVYMPSALQGSLKAAEYVLKLQERRAKYLGLDAPAQVDVTTRVRLLAREMGYDEQQAIDAAERILKATNGNPSATTAL